MTSLNLTLRQKIGAGLIMASLLAAIAIQVATGDLVHISTNEEPPVKGPIGSTQVIIHMATFTWRYAAPLLVFAASGLCLILLPGRRKPNA